MFLSHGGRPTKGNGRKRKGVDEYAAENRVDFTSRSIIRDGQLVRILVCRFCCQSIGARSDRIKEHLASKRHQKLKLEAFREAAEAGRDLSQEYSDDSVSGHLPEPPITMLKFPGKALAHLLEGEGGRQSSRELTPDIEDRKPVIPTPPPLKEHILNSQLPQSIHPSVGMHPHSLPSVLGGVRGGGGGSLAGTPTPPPQHPPTPIIPHKESAPQQLLCVRWGNFDSNIITMFSKLRSLEHFCDVTLWCEGRTVKCHKMVLSACSTYFEQLLTENLNQNVHPIIFLKDMRFWEIQALVEFMYKGEVSIHQEKLQSLLRAAESLQIKGLGSPSNEHHNGNGGNGGAEEHGGSAGSSGSHNASASGAEDDLSNETMDMSASSNQHRLANDQVVAVANSANQNRVTDDDILVNSHSSHTSTGSSRNTNMSMGMDLSNHGNHGNQNIIHQTSSISHIAAGWSLHPPPTSHVSPAKRRRKETPRRIDIPKGPNPPHPMYSSPMQSQSDELADDDDAMSEDSMTVHERNHNDEGVKIEPQSDMNYEDSNDHDGPENYAENNYTEHDHVSQPSNGEDSSDQGDMDEDIDGGGGNNEPLELNANIVATGLLNERERDMRDRERSRKGNPIKKIHLGLIGNNNNNNNNNNDTGGTPTLIHNAPTSVIE